MDLRPLTPLRVFGPSETSALCRGLERAYAFDVHVIVGTSTKLPARGGARAARARRRIGLGRGHCNAAFLVDLGSSVRPRCRMTLGLARSSFPATRALPRTS
jgi:hypothetical protein